MGFLQNSCEINPGTELLYRNVVYPIINGKTTISDMATCCIYDITFCCWRLFKLLNRDLHEHSLQTWLKLLVFDLEFTLVHSNVIMIR